jgi:hypothetical protein
MSPLGDGDGSDPVGYIKCQNPAYESQVGMVVIEGTISDDNWDDIDVSSDDGCMVLTMFRTNTGQ